MLRAINRAFCRLLHWPFWKYHTQLCAPTCLDTTLHAGCPTCDRVYKKILRDEAPSDFFWTLTPLSYKQLKGKFS